MAISALSLGCHVLTSQAQQDTRLSNATLGTVRFLPSRATHFCADNASLGWQATAPLPALDEAGNSVEVSEIWQTAAPVRHARHETVQLAYNDDVLFGAVQLTEAPSPAHFADGRAQPPLQVAAHTAYSAIFSALEQFGFPHVLRFWNYIPDINQTSHGLERYRQFNTGRQIGFLLSARPVEGAVVPAASAVGCDEGPLVVHFLAARATPVIAVENPRQVSAYHYPQQYGPRTPTFSRASLFHLAGGPALFVSGTASIVGHASVHTGDIGAQVGETMENIAAVVQEANRIEPNARFALAEMAYRVYVRDPADCPAIAQALHRFLGPSVRPLYLQADICRKELLVEIEAVAGLA